MPAAPAAPTAVKQANLNHQVFAVGEGIPNLDHPSSQEFEKAIRAKYDLQPVLSARRQRNADVLRLPPTRPSRSIRSKVCGRRSKAWSFEVFDGGKGASCARTITSFFQPMYIASLGRADRKRSRFDEEKTGWGWKLVAKIDTTPQTMLPTTCKMDRPN